MDRAGRGLQRLAVVLAKSPNAAPSSESLPPALDPPPEPAPPPLLSPNIHPPEIRTPEQVAADLLRLQIEIDAWKPLFPSHRAALPYCLDHGRSDLGIVRLASLLADVEREEATARPPWAAGVLAFLRTLAAQLRA